jgi:serine phosphatase RsbU (regulator of sigma subunit)
VSLCRDETEALKVLAAQSASAIENAQRFERQRTVARRLQEGLLATEMPAIEGCSVAAVYEPATGEADIGGDFYDVFELDAGVYGIVVGDVSGKGAEAAAQTAQAKYVLRAFAMRNPTPASVLFHLNNALVQTLGEDRFATVVYGVLEAGPRRLQVAVAGHPSPLVYRHESGEVEEVTPAGMVVGAFPDVQFDQETIELHNGDVWLAYTDGLVEARLDKELFGYDRLKDALVRLAPGLGMNELTRRLYDEAGDFGKVGDDTVILGLACDPRLP